MEADTPEEAAQQVSTGMEDVAGSVYTVQSEGGSEPPLTVTIGSI